MATWRQQNFAQSWRRVRGTKYKLKNAQDESTDTVEVSIGASGAQREKARKAVHLSSIVRVVGDCKRKTASDNLRSDGRWWENRSFSTNDAESEPCVSARHRDETGLTKFRIVRCEGAWEFDELSEAEEGRS